MSPAISARRRATFIRCFSRLQWPADETLDRHDTVLPDGDAISPESAARCVLDYTRTSRFLRAMRLALQAALERFSERPLDILYAGCGPFAPLGLLLTHRFSPLDVRFTLIDVHELSLNSARRVFEAFGRGEFIGDCLACGAATYRHPTAMHVVIAETMCSRHSGEVNSSATAWPATRQPTGIRPRCMSLSPRPCRGRCRRSRRSR